MKKRIVLLLTLMFMGCLSMVTACKTNDNESTRGMGGIVLSQETVTLDFNQEYWLSAEFDGEETLVWTTGDSTIVSVENGKLVGLKAGTTTVTVTAGGCTDTCTVTVAEYNPANFSLSLSKTNTSLYKNEEEQIVATVTYNGKAVSIAAETSYQSTNSEIVSVDEKGKLTAKAYGDATISVICEVEDIELTGSINVSVISSGAVEIVQSYVDLDVSEQNNTATLEAKAYEKGVEQSGATITWSAPVGQDVVVVNGNVLTALNAGETTVTASYIDGDGVSKTDTIPVTVLPITVDSQKTLVLSKNEYPNGYSTDWEAFIGVTGAITGGYVVANNGLTTELTYADGKYDISSLSAGEKEFYLQTRNITYKISLSLWTATISNATDLKVLLTATDGWYQLANDVTVSENWQYEEKTEFEGLFDGNGYAITFTTENGLFDVLAGDALVQNVTLNAKVNNGGAVAATIKTGANVTLKDITVYVDLWGASNGGLVGDVSGGLTVKNIGGAVTIANQDNTNGALFGISSAMATLENVEVYSSLTLCGQSTENNSQAESLNAMTGVVVAPLASELLIKVSELEESGANGKEIKIADGTYASYTVVGNTVRQVTAATSGTAMLKLADVAERFVAGSQIGGKVDVLFKKADGSVDYYSLSIDTTIYLSNSNFATYLRKVATETVSGYYMLSEDINMQTVYANAGISAWGTYAVFAGTLDGDGHKITNFVASYPNVTKKRHGGLFHQTNDATFKNLIIEEAVLTTLCGVFAYENLGTTTFENVYVSLAEQEFAESGDNRLKGGLFSNVKKSSTIVLKNCVIYIPTHTVQASGFVAGLTTYSIETENCTFIGGNGLLAGTGSDNTKFTQTNTAICTEAQAYATLGAKQESELTFAEKAFLRNFSTSI